MTGPQDSVVPTRTPISTYRLQLTPDFTFDHAREIAPYLAKLGVTDLYLSPIFRAKPGSTHGYDICDFGQLNPELGGNEGFARLLEVLNSLGMGIVQDFVPNHMAVEPVLNPWWRGMLEHGQASPFAKHFDVDWNPIKPELRGKILLPFLGDHYGLVLERGELVAEYDSGGFVIRYFERTRPIDPRQYPRILQIGLSALRAEMGDDPAIAELLSIVTSLDHIPTVSNTDSERIAERLRECRVARERIARLVDSSPRIRKHIEDALRSINGNPGDPSSFDALHDLLESLPYRLAYWKTAVHEINYRRFFDINELAGLRVEEPDVFDAMHGLLLKLIVDGSITGLRLDHVDGLFDPVEYTRRLQTAVMDERAKRAAKNAEIGPIETRPIYVVAEKILTGDEALPAWAAEGTTGYDFLNDVSRLLVNPRSAPFLRHLHSAYTGKADPFREVVYDCKKLITWTSLASELNVLADALDRSSEYDRRTRDFTLDSLREALREVAVCFPVYRTYIGPQGATEDDRRVVDLAIRRARLKNPAMESSVFDFVRDNLVPDHKHVSEEIYAARLRFAMKFQQYSGPLQAKGVEDTSFYRYNVLVSLNEVGGDPQRHGGTIVQFHNANQLRAARNPRAMLSTATHDTKRGEDARARIHVLSELPRAWQNRVLEWTTINAECRSIVEGAEAPDRSDEYLFYQTLVGCWPAGESDPVAPKEFVVRVRDYMLKAIKESKVHTSWISANEAYDLAVRKFVEDSLTGAQSVRFLTKFIRFQRTVARAGMINSLAQLVLKTASPGVPDFYQGTDLWDFSLVDPDNRRPVNYTHHAKWLAEFEPWLDGAASPPEGDWAPRLIQKWSDGRVKLFATACGMRLRRKHPELFLAGDYRAVTVEGELHEHVVAFLRHLDDEWVLAVVPRFSASLIHTKRTLPVGPVWGQLTVTLPAELAGRTGRNAYTGAVLSIEAHDDGGRVNLSEILKDFPVALVHFAGR